MSLLKTFRNKYSILKEYSDRCHKSMFHLFWDYYRINRKKGIYFQEYKDFSLGSVDSDYLDSFLGFDEQVFYLDKLNPVKYYSLARNKYIAHCVLEPSGIRMPRLLGYYHPSTEYNSIDNHFSTCQQVIDGLKRHGKHNIVIKTTESSHGDGVWVIDDIQYQSGDVLFHLANDKIVYLSEIISIGVPFIIEECIKQTKQFEQFNPTSVNTIRFMTTLYPDGNVKVIGAFIKIGRSGSFIDNAGSGGNIDANVNIIRGMLEHVVEFQSFSDIRPITEHPDNGCPLEGVKIENWDLIIDTMKKYQQSFPFIKAIGWDVAITDDGPVIIEINDFWDRTGQLFIGKGWRNEIRDCFMEWNKTGYNPIVERCPLHMSGKSKERITGFK